MYPSVSSVFPSNKNNWFFWPAGEYVNPFKVLQAWLLRRAPPEVALLCSSKRWESNTSLNSCTLKGRAGGRESSVWDRQSVRLATSPEPLVCLYPPTTHEKQHRMQSSKKSPSPKCTSNVIMLAIWAISSADVNQCSCKRIYNPLEQLKIQPTV